MKTNSKFNLGQEVWFYDKEFKAPRKAKIFSIEFTIHGDVKYRFYGQEPELPICLMEARLFNTPEEVTIPTLLSDCIKY